METTYSLLSESEIEGQNLEITIQASGQNLSTAAYQPPKTEADSRNPQPVSGVAPAAATREIDPSLEKDIPLTRAPDGRYVFDPTVIIGPDDRVRVGNPAAWPWSVQGHMIMRFPNGKTYIGSGTMVNRHHVLTAGHCVYSHSDGGWATSIQFNPAQNDSNLPFGSAVATRLASVVGWTRDADSNWDVGMLILNRDVGANTGWLGVITFGSDGPLNRYRVNVSGYPGDKGGQQLWTMADVIKAVNAERFFYDIDTMGGQSGSGVWSTWQGHAGEKVAGIHTTGSSSGNGATRISRAKFDRIVEWMQQW